jgi:hypothetical protein
MVESCEAATMLSRITAPRVIAMASSIKGERALLQRVVQCVWIAKCDTSGEQHPVAPQRLRVKGQLLFVMHEGMEGGARGPQVGDVHGGLCHAVLKGTPC